MGRGILEARLPDIVQTVFPKRVPPRPPPRGNHIFMSKCDSSWEPSQGPLTLT